MRKTKKQTLKKIKQYIKKKLIFSCEDCGEVIIIGDIDKKKFINELYKKGVRFIEAENYSLKGLLCKDCVELYKD